MDDVLTDRRDVPMRDMHAAWSTTTLPYPADSFSYDVKELGADRY